MSLAIFDLDNTLIAGDSDYLWGQFMVSQNMVDTELFEQGNRQFYQQYEAGTMVIEEYLNFSLQPLKAYSLSKLRKKHQQFMADCIRPIMLEKAVTLLDQHRSRGDHLMIITSTNRFITEPIARELGIESLLAIDLEIEAERYTGRILGTPTYQGGKVVRLKHWLDSHSEYSLADSYFYSDSQNDIPLLRKVGHPCVVDGDEVLTQLAVKEGWKHISLR